jgi:hypothetical protein
MVNVRNLKRRQCPGSRSNANCYQDYDWCPVCGVAYKMRFDGTIRAHPMRYAVIVEHMAKVVREVEIRDGCHLPTDWYVGMSRSRMSPLRGR